MILGRLKESTREQHENLESIVDVMNKMFSLDDYKRLLTKFYRFYASVEPKVFANDVSKYGIDKDARLKTPSLEKDLKALGIWDEVKSNAASLDAIPSYDTAAKAFGAMYVMEGATLGGQIIKRHLKEHLGLSPDNGGAFFTSYGENVGPMWKSFGASITQFDEETGESDEIVDSAKETFDAFAASFRSGEAAAV